MELVDTGFQSGVDLTRNQMPQGPGYLLVLDPVGQFQAARRIISQWSNRARRQSAESVMEFELQFVMEGQEHLLLRKEDLYTYNDPIAVDDLFELLRDLRQTSASTKRGEGEGTP